MNRLIVLGVFAALLVTTGCPKGNQDQERCEKVADKTFAMAKELGMSMAKMLGAEKAAEMEKQMDADMAKEKPAVIASCIEAVKKDPEVIPVMDCLIGAADLEAASKCDPEGKLKNLGPKGGE